MTCDNNIFKNGYALVDLGGDSDPEIIENLCNSCNEELKESKIDWHYQGGRAIVLFIGNYQEVVSIVTKHLPQYNESTYQYRCRQLEEKILYPRGLSERDLFPPNMKSIGQILNS